MPTPSYELPYEGAKEMLLVDEVDNKEFLTGLFYAMYDELPAPKPKKKEINNLEFVMKEKWILRIYYQQKIVMSYVNGYRKITIK